MPAAHYQGLSIPPHKQWTHEQAISTAPASAQMVLPLTQHGDTELIPCVAVGDNIRMGQIIARPLPSLNSSSLSACLHASVSGSVAAIELRPSAKPASAALSIVLHNDFQDTPALNLQATPAWSTLSSIALCKHLALGGIVGLGGAVFSLASKAAAHTRQAIDQLIINGVECEPFITCDDRLMREQAMSILLGTQILLHATQAQRAVIAIESDKPEAITAIQAALEILDDSHITIRSIVSAYPSGDEAQLIRQVAAKEIPRGQLPAGIGFTVSNVATVYACARWILHGEPLISRVVTVSGNGVTKPGNYATRIGTPMRDLLQHCGAEFTTEQTLVMGGAMMGHALAHADYPIIKASNCLILSTQGELKPVATEHECIRCGDCAHACPVHLLPQQLLVHSRQGNTTALQQLGLQDCIECGNCDYVCPSHIRLSTRFHDAKRIA
jgi:electron transport complex protein RnfC